MVNSFKHFLFTGLLLPDLITHTPGSTINASLSTQAQSEFQPLTNNEHDTNFCVVPLYLFLIQGEGWMRDEDSAG